MSENVDVMEVLDTGEIVLNKLFFMFQIMLHCSNKFYCKCLVLAKFDNKS